MVAQNRFRENRGDDRNRIREAGRLHDHPAKRRNLTPGRPVLQVANGEFQVRADGAADAAALHQQHALLDLLEEQVIEADLPEFVDDDRGVREGGMLQRLAKERCLAATQKPGNNVDGDHGTVRRGPSAAR